MTRQYQRYDKDVLSEMVANCQSFAEVCRRLGKRPVGGTVTNMKLMCRRWNIDFSHMTGQGHAKGKRSNKRLLPEQRLVMGTDKDHRVAANKLRAALFDIGVEHKCAYCGINEWLGKQLVLEIDHIDHIDQQYWNNTKENLQFLCPNCHSQKTIMPR